jgi:hypothetical protein
MSVQLHLSPLKNKTLPQTSQQSQAGTAPELAACYQCTEQHTLYLKTNKTQVGSENKGQCVTNTNTNVFTVTLSKETVCKQQKQNVADYYKINKKG